MIIFLELLRQNGNDDHHYHQPRMLLEGSFSLCTAGATCLSISCLIYLRKLPIELDAHVSNLGYLLMSFSRNYCNAPRVLDLINFTIYSHCEFLLLRLAAFDEDN